MALAISILRGRCLRIRLELVEVGQSGSVGPLPIIVGQEAAGRGVVRVPGEDGHRPFQPVLIPTVTEHPRSILRSGVGVARMMEDLLAQSEQLGLVPFQPIEGRAIGLGPLGVVEPGPNLRSEVQSLGIERIGPQCLIEVAPGGVRYAPAQLELGQSPRH